MTVSGSRIIVKNVTLSELIHVAYDLPATNTQDYQISGAPSWATAGGDYYDIEARAAGDGTTSTDQARLMLQTLISDRFRMKFHRESKVIPVYEVVISKSGLKMKKMPPPPWPPAAARQQRNSVEDLDTMISRFADRPIVDKTGLAGIFEFAHWDQADLEESSISVLVEDRLGLRLDPAKRQVEVIVIDHVEKPTEN